MAEFLEVMKQKKRMCEKYTGRGICQSIDYDICPLKGHDLCSKPITLINIDKIQEGEEISMRVAAKHLEPVYPRWCDWLAEQGVLADMRYWYAMNTEKMEQPIPADIAQKLGIEPKGE